MFSENLSTFKTLSVILEICSYNQGYCSTKNQYEMKILKSCFLHYCIVQNSVHAIALNGTLITIRMSRADLFGLPGTSATHEMTGIAIHSAILNKIL